MKAEETFPLQQLKNRPKKQKWSVPNSLCWRSRKEGKKKILDKLKLSDSPCFVTKFYCIKEGGNKWKII